MSATLSPRPLDYLGAFLVTLATLMYQILLTRIFSVTMWYHFAFMAISLSMFGFTVGAMLVYLFPKRFSHAKTTAHLAISAAAFGVAIVFSFLTQQSIPFTTVDLGTSIVAAYSIFLIYTVLAIPFVCSGVCVCLLLTRFPNHVSKLYAADLAGSALGCVLVIPALRPPGWRRRLCCEWPPREIPHPRARPVSVLKKIRMGTAQSSAGCRHASRHRRR